MAAGQPQQQNFLNPTCEDYHSDDSSEDLTLESFWPAAVQANVAAKRPQPYDLDTSGNSPAHEKVPISIEKNSLFPPLPKKAPPPGLFKRSIGLNGISETKQGRKRKMPGLHFSYTISQDETTDSRKRQRLRCQTALGGATIPPIVLQREKQGHERGQTKPQPRNQAHVLPTTLQDQPLTEQARLRVMPEGIEPSLRADLLRVPEDIFRTLLPHFIAENRRSQGILGVQFPGW